MFQACVNHASWRRGLYSNAPGKEGKPGHRTQVSGREKNSGGAPLLVPKSDPWDPVEDDCPDREGHPSHDEWGSWMAKTRLAFYLRLFWSTDALPIPPCSPDETPELRDVIRNKTRLFRVTSIVGHRVEVDEMHDIGGVRGRQ